MGGGHLAGFFGAGPAAAIAEPVVVGALWTRNALFFGDGLVARNPGLTDFSQAALGVNEDFLSDNVVTTEFAL